MENRTCDFKEPSKLYRIGVFSQMNRVTVKALHYYDEIGLLHPAFLDEHNGYRYYTSEQMPSMHKILALRDIGFSIQEIQQVFDGGNEEALLQRKKRQMMHEMANISMKLACIESYLTNSDFSSEYRIIVKTLPEVNIASMRIHMDSYVDLFHKMPDMGRKMEIAGCECLEPGYCFTIYYDEGYKEHDIDAEICEAVTTCKPDQGNLKFRKLDEVELAACVLHKGPYHKLPQAYRAVVHYIEESGYEIVGNQRESYIDGIWNKDSEDDWLTEIQFPVRAIDK